MHDILLSGDGDLVPNWRGGLSDGDGTPIDYQDILWRMKTNDPEYALADIGANLEDLIGLPNVPTTGARGEASIIKALTAGGRFSPQILTVTGVPVGLHEIQFFVGVQQGTTVKTTTPLFTTILNLSP